MERHAYNYDKEAMPEGKSHICGPLVKSTASHFQSFQTLQNSLYHQWFSYDIKCLMSSAAAKELLSHTNWHVKLVCQPYLENKVIPFSAI